MIVGEEVLHMGFVTSGAATVGLVEVGTKCVKYDLDSRFVGEDFRTERKKS